jgi:hypothetical protein
MALATTTLSAAVSVTDNTIVVASATSVAAGRLILIDQEVMKVVSSYTSGTTVGVLRGQDGSVTAAHKVTANVTHGLASDFASPAAQTTTTYPTARATQVVSITATSTLTLPTAGTDLRVVLNGTSVITLTIPVPTKDMDGTELSIVGNGAAAHLLTFTGGLSGAGTSYDVITVNATAPIAFKVIAANGLWVAYAAPALTGTVTNITGGIA